MKKIFKVLEKLTIKLIRRVAVKGYKWLGIKIKTR